MDLGAHLGCDFSLGGRFANDASLADVVGQGLLAMDMFSEATPFKLAAPRSAVPITAMSSFPFT